MSISSRLRAASHRRRVAPGVLGTALVVLLALSSAAIRGAVSDPGSVQSLLNAISQDGNYFDPNRKPNYEIELAVELGDSALPELESRLERTNTDRERLGLGTAITYIGGASAVRSLETAVKRSPSPQLKGRFAFAIPSAPSSDFIPVLEAYLQGPHIGGDWPLIVQAAHSLGIMRAQAAVPALLAAANEGGGFASEAARDALDWIGGPDVSVKFLVPGPNDDLLQAILASGVPEINRRSSWCEGSAGRKWKRAQRTWIVGSACSSAKQPTIGFDAFRSSDGSRAIVTIGFYLGPLDAAGYRYLLLRKSDNQWAVTGLEFSWVS
jgi:hypothetical protein